MIATEPQGRARRDVLRRRGQVAERISCGPDVAEHVAKIRPFLDAGFDEVALVQIGAEGQEPFIAWAQRELLPALRAL